MEISPEKIYDDIKAGNLDKTSAIESLISIVENSDIDDIRVKSLEILEKIDVNSDSIFKFLENLMISDSSGKIRNTAVFFIKKHFKDRAFNIMKWAIKYETDYDILVTIIKTLEDINSKESKVALIDELKRIVKVKYLDKERRIDNKKFKKSLKKLLREKSIDSITHSTLAEIAINFMTISLLTKKFYSVFFEVEKGLIVKLDLADVEYEVRGWKGDYKNNIRKISEITGLSNLKNLTELNISNNLIEDIKDLVLLEKLTHLYISNNKIKDLKNLAYLKKMTKLNYLDIAGNQISNHIDITEFKNLELNLKKFYI